MNVREWKAELELLSSNMNSVSQRHLTPFVWNLHVLDRCKPKADPSISQPLPQRGLVAKNMIEIASPHIYLGASCSTLKTHLICSFRLLSVGWSGMIKLEDFHIYQRFGKSVMQEWMTFHAHSNKALCVLYRGGKLFPPSLHNKSLNRVCSHSRSSRYSVQTLFEKRLPCVEKMWFLSCGSRGGKRKKHSCTCLVTPERPQNEVVSSAFLIRWFGWSHRETLRPTNHQGRKRARVRF